MNIVCHKKKVRGFSLLEVVVAIAVFVIFALGVYGGIQFIFKIIYQSRVRIVETALLNEQMEIIRNMSFYDVGIIQGSPAGILVRNVTTTRSGIDFLITRTIRNIDDPYDGVMGGTPNDLSPTDYKLVDIAIICLYCGQREPLTAQTYVAPKLLEGDPTHGALFIEVFDAQAQPVVGATVRIVSTSTEPTYDFEDTTDNNGMLRIVDLAEGIDAYSIFVTKEGFTSDGTIIPSVSNLHPTKPPATVRAQRVTEVSFSIDYISKIEIESINTQCQPVGSVSFDMSGTYLLGTNPDLYRVNGTYTTDSSGQYNFSSLAWDNYGFLVSGYDLVGTIPNTPFVLNPGITQPLQLVVGPNTARSLLVMVDGNGLPMANADVRVSNDSYNVLKKTGVGSLTQTDWSSGAGQLYFSHDAMYWADDGNVDVESTVGDLLLKKIGQYYVSNGMLESSVIDVGTEAHYVTLQWNPLGQIPEVGLDGLRFQIASSASSTSENWEYVGPDGTSATFYTDNSQSIHEIHEGNQYIRYKVYMQTDDVGFTPTLSDVSIIFTNECTPPGQVYFGNLVGGEYTIEVSKEGYQIYTTTIVIDEDEAMIVDLVTS